MWTLKTSAFEYNLCQALGVSMELRIYLGSLRILMGVCLVLLVAACGHSHSDLRATHDGKGASFQEKQCMASGWQRVELQVAGLRRVLLWKAPDSPWSKGAILVLHGGGGQLGSSCETGIPGIVPRR